MAKGRRARLWQENQDLAEACLRHCFVQGLGDGSLDREQFKGYVAQDAYFLEAFARAYALALARCPDRQGLYALVDMLTGALEELKLHGAIRGAMGRRSRPGDARLGDAGTTRISSWPPPPRRRWAQSVPP